MKKLSSVGWVLNPESLMINNRQGEIVAKVYPVFENIHEDFLPTQHKNQIDAIKVGSLLADAPLLLSRIELMLAMYAKGIQPSIGFINDVESLIQKHS